MHDIDKFDNPAAFIDLVCLILNFFHTWEIILELMAVTVGLFMLGVQEIFLLLMVGLVMEPSFGFFENLRVVISLVFTA